MSNPTVASVDDVIITPQLWNRPQRAPDHAAENRALESLAAAMSNSPKSVFDELVKAARDLCRAGSAGVSVWEQDNGSEVFRWRATAGEYAPYLGETLPRAFSPCGTVLDRNSTLLMADPVRFFPYIDQLCSPVREVLLIPFYQGSTPIGTVWVAAHDADKHFDAEDLRVVTNLAKFAAAAVSVLNRMQVAENSQDELREVRTRLESTLIAGEIGTWVYDIERDQVRADRNLARMFGVSEVDASGGPLEAYIKAIHPDDHPRVVELISAAVESGTTFDAEYRLQVDGRLTWVVARGTVERNSAGRAVRLPGVVVDITARKRTEQDLRASESRRHLALDAAELGTWNIDPTTNELTSDERFRQIFGTTTEDLTYEEAFAKIHPDDVANVRDRVAAATQPEDPAPYVAEYRVVKADGSITWVFAQGRANFITDGGQRRLHSFDGIVADITPRKLAAERALKQENELRRIAAELSEADHRKNEFLAMLAHELRNPLAPIRNGLSVIELSADNAQVVREASGMMDRQIDHMVRLVDDLLDVSRITRGKIDLRMEKVDIGEVVRQAVENSRPVIQANGHQLWLQLLDRPYYVQADAVRLAQVFGNLLNNACKYSEPRGQIWLSVTQQGNEVVVSVKDTGVGIAAPMLPKIFELFTQIDQSLERSQGGLGIGLSLVRSLVDLHGGRVTAVSEGVGHGSEFIVRLPILELGTIDSHVAKPQNGAQLSSLRILVVDDNYDSATSLAMLLKILGNETRTAHDGEQAVAAAEQFRPNIILLDIGLPILNGYEVARKLRSETWGQELVLVALTGWGQEEDRRKSREAGFDGHLVKPVNQAELKSLLTDLLSQRGCKP